MGRRNNSSRADNLRRLVAYEAARLMSEHGLDDFYVAKRKAAEKLGLADSARLPRNTEIEAALAENLRIFAADELSARLHKLRTAARDAMQFFHDFNPRLVGSVLAGTAAEGNDVELHLFAETSEQVALRLIEREVPHRPVDHRIRMPGEGHVRFPGFRFLADDTPVLAIVFPHNGLRSAPVSPVDGRAMRRATLAEVEKLLAERA